MCFLSPAGEAHCGILVAPRMSRYYTASLLSRHVNFHGYRCSLILARPFISALISLPFPSAWYLAPVPMHVFYAVLSVGLKEIARRGEPPFVRDSRAALLAEVYSPY